MINWAYLLRASSSCGTKIEKPDLGNAMEGARKLVRRYLLNQYDLFFLFLFLFSFSHLHCPNTIPGPIMSCDSYFCQLRDEQLGVRKLDEKVLKGYVGEP